MESAIILFIELVGIVAFATAGAVVASGKGMDIFGVPFIGVITAVGGGVVRDIFLGIFPPIMFTYKIYTFTAIITSLVVFFIALKDNERFFRNVDKIDSVVNIFDAIGIGMFSVSSVQRCIDFGYGDNAFLCIMMAMTSCIGGSIVRDLICQRMPALLSKNIYALATIAGGAIYYYMIIFNCNHELAMILGAGTTIAIRLLATKFKWNMPRINIKDD